MLDSEVEVKTLAKENQRLRKKLFGRTILAWALGTALIAFIFIAAILARMLAD